MLRFYIIDYTCTLLWCYTRRYDNTSRYTKPDVCVTLCIDVVRYRREEVLERVVGPGLLELACNFPSTEQTCILTIDMQDIDMKSYHVPRMMCYLNENCYRERLVCVTLT